MLPTIQELNAKTRQSVYQRFSTIFYKISNTVHQRAAQGEYNCAVSFSCKEIENIFRFIFIDGITMDGKIESWVNTFKLFDDFRDQMQRDTDVEISGCKTDTGYQFSLDWSDRALTTSIMRRDDIAFNADKTQSMAQDE